MIYSTNNIIGVEFITGSKKLEEHSCIFRIYAVDVENNMMSYEYGSKGRIPTKSGDKLDISLEYLNSGRYFVVKNPNNIIYDIF